MVSECINLVASSGSTGFPKLIVTPARGVVESDPAVGSTRGDIPMVVLVLSPLYHVNGFAFAAPAMLEGGRVVILEKFDAERAVELIERHQITFTVMVPTMLQRVARLPNLRREQLASLQRVVYGGARVPDWVVERWLELVDPSVFVFSYGSSERLGLVMMNGEEWAAHPGATGKPVDVELSIRDAEGTPLPPGEVGEIFMRPLGPRRLFEYIGMPTPDPTADGFYTIGDVGWLDDDGYLYVTDRRTDMIVSGGANVFPAEVENALSEHPDVVDQVVVGVPDDEWGQRVHAILQVTDPAHPPPTTSSAPSARSGSPPTRCPRPSRSSSGCPAPRPASSTAPTSAAAAPTSRARADREHQASAARLRRRGFARFGSRRHVGETPAVEEGDEAEHREDRQRSTQGIQAGSGVLVDDRRGGLGTHACVLERSLEVGVGDERHATGELGLRLRA